jgi:hypothetical protein
MSDYSPPYTEDDAKRENRRDKAVAKIKKVPAANLTVGDIVDIIEAFGEYRHDMNEHDVKTIERILKNKGRK